MAIELTCGACGKTLRVADEYAGRRASCPSCNAVIDIPAASAPDTFELEELEPLEEAAAPTPTADADDADDSGYAMDDDALGALAPTAGASATPVSAAERMEASGLAMPTPVKSRAGSQPLPGFEARVDMDESAKEARAAARKALVVKAVLALMVLGAVGGVGYLYMTTIGKMVFVEAQSVKAVHALDNIDTADQNQTLSNQILNPWDGIDAGMSMGGDGGIYVTKPDSGGDYLLVTLDIREGVLLSRNQTQGYNIRFRASQFEVVPDVGSPFEPIMLRGSVDSPVEIGLSSGTSPEPVLPAGYEPASAEYESKGRYDQAAGTLTYDGSNGVEGEVNFTSLRAFNPDASGMSGVNVEGALTLNDRSSGLKLDYAYDGFSAKVTWGGGAEGWMSSESYLLGKVTTMELHRCMLLIPKPAGATSFQIKLVGAKLVTFHATASSSGAPTSRPSAPTQAAPPAQQVASAEAEGADDSAQASAANASASAGNAAASSGSATSNNPLSYLSTLASARDKAKGTVAASNLRQLGVALNLYRQEHGTFPDEIEKLRDYLAGFDELMNNPRTGDNPGFIYEAPSPGDNPAETVVMWEARRGFKDLSGHVLYADGRVSDE
ncbi:MAG: hypothetical protein AAF078_07380 [Planctomycetota bacterium]